MAEHKEYRYADSDQEVFPSPDWDVVHDVIIDTGYGDDDTKRYRIFIDGSHTGIPLYENELDDLIATLTALKEGN